MTPPDPDAAPPGKGAVQTNKLYIKIMQKTNKIPQLEQQFRDYFGEFGPVDDIKILKNSALKRKRETVRVRVLPGRSLRP